jgi:hypothetical protein
MTPELREVFERYVRHAVESLRPDRSALGSRGPVRPVANRDRETRDAVAALEGMEEFVALVEATRLAFRRDRHAVETFFRRSGFYLQAAAGEAPPIDEIFRQYPESFESRERRATYLAPLEGVSLARDTLDCGAFALRRFSSNELEGVFQTRVNRVFYERALSDVDFLSNYWFLTLTKTKETGTGLNLDDIGRITPTYTTFKEIEAALLAV